MKKKLNLNELKVKSFVTDFSSEDSQTLRGGIIVDSLNFRCGPGGPSGQGWTCAEPCISGTEPPDSFEQCTHPLACN